MSVSEDGKMRDRKTNRRSASLQLPSLTHATDAMQAAEDDVAWLNSVEGQGTEVGYFFGHAGDAIVIAS